MNLHLFVWDCETIALYIVARNEWEAMGLVVDEIKHRRMDVMLLKERGAPLQIATITGEAIASSDAPCIIAIEEKY